VIGPKLAGIGHWNPAKTVRSMLDSDDLAAVPALQHARKQGAEVTTAVESWGRMHPNDPAAAPMRYAEWTRALKRANLWPIERLLPTITIAECGKMPPAMRRAAAGTLGAEMLREIRKYNWGYYFHVGNGQSTLGAEAHENGIQRTARQRMLYRMNAINGAVAALYGGKLSGKTMLDLACNHGAFSLDMAIRGIRSARGVDLRAENVAKANLLARLLEVENVQFVEGDIWNEVNARSSIVYCLGLLYHVTQPYELVELCYQVCTDMAVIDTITHREPVSGFLLGTGQMIPEHAAGRIRTELHPTYRALIDLMRVVGFREVIEVEGMPDPGWTDWQSDIYATKLRRCLIGLR
jgi:SAM-dependent methyltransferase